MTHSVLSVRGLCHSYGELEVLKGLDFDLDAGEVFGLLGPNGSGKSTAFAVIAGLQARQSGDIKFEGRAIQSADRQMRSAMGVVFQSPSLDPKLSCRQNLKLCARLTGISGKALTTRIDELLELADLRERADDLVGELSGGMCRRLDLARALSGEPRLLLMDEPTAGLDEAAFRSTWSRLNDMRKGRNLSILLTTHRPEEAEHCDRLAIINNGQAVVTDTPENLKRQVASDVVALTGTDSEGLCQIASAFGESRVFDGDVLIECEKGHELIPRLVESVPNGQLQAVSLRRPSLADVFLKVTGKGLLSEL